MKVNFNKNANMIVDFIKFPELIFFDKDNISNNTKKMLDEDFMQEYLLLVDEIKDSLKDYEKDIKKFLHGGSSKSLNIMEYIYDDMDIIKYNHKDELFDDLMNRSRDALISPIIAGILASEIYYDTEEMTDEVRENTLKEIDLLLDDDKKLFDFVKDSDLEPEFKWTLTIFINNPKDFISQYIEVMNKIYPIFLGFYERQEAKINDMGIRLKDYFEKYGPEGIDNISNSLLSKDIFSEEQEINLFISFVQANLLSLSESYHLKKSKLPVNTIQWGLNTEKIFDRLKKEQEDKLANRIDIFKSLGDETRYSILKMIAKGVSPNKEIAKRVGVSGATVSYHINTFVDNGVVVIKRIDNKLTHVIDYDVLKNLIEDFKEDFNI